MYDLTATLAEIRAAGGDTAAVEVKSAAGGLPQTLPSTLGAFANRPGGGVLILGLDEATGFKPVTLKNVQTLKQGLENQARSFTPPVQVTIEDAIVDGVAVIVATVRECPVDQKPCQKTSTGQVWVRGYDGDHEASALERQAFLVNRTHPRVDRDPVAGTRVDDLDPALRDEWMASVRANEPTGLGRFTNDDEILRRGGVVAASGELTMAGLLALGAYPQQFFPRYEIAIAKLNPPGSPVRAIDARALTGPITSMLAEAMKWFRANLAPTIVTDPNGTVRNDAEYPLAALREIVSNALVHRDLGDWARGFATDIRVLPDRMITTNPGGLFGVSVDRLGTVPISSPRNDVLLAICRHVTEPGSGGRVVEGLATGIPTVTAALADADLPPAQYIDEGIRFTVVLRKPGTKAAAKTTGRVQGPAAKAILAALTTTPVLVTEVMRLASKSDEHSVRRILRTLEERRLAVSATDATGLLTYRRADD